MMKTSMQTSDFEDFNSRLTYSLTHYCEVYQSEILLVIFTDLKQDTFVLI